MSLKILALLTILTFTLAFRWSPGAAAEPVNPTLPEPLLVTGISITVTTTMDDMTINGNCTLREALRAAQTNLPVDACPSAAGVNTVILPAGHYRLSLPGVNEDQGLTGDLDIYAPVFLQGAGPSVTFIDAQGIDRVFNIHAGGDLRASNLTITGGNSVGVSDGRGGGVYNNSGTVVLTNVVIAGNFAENTGGGIDNFGGLLNIFDSAILDNTALDGGGMLNDGTLVMNRSLVAGNTADEYGGGLDNNGAAVLVNVTFSGNQTEMNPGTPGVGYGGGIFNDGTLDLLNVTLAEHTGDGLVNSGTIRSKHVLVGNNLPNNCGGAGGFVSQGHNLESANTCNFNLPSDQHSLPVLLGPLAANGGRTETYALLPSSPAIDAGDNNACPALDQRGFIRPAAGSPGNPPVCDIGAFELNARFGGVYLPLVRR